MTLLEWSSINILMSKKLANKFSEAENNEDFHKAGESLIRFIEGFQLDIQALNDDNTDLIIHNRVDKTGIYLKIDDREFTNTVIFLTDELKKLIEVRFSKDMEEDRKVLEDIMNQLNQGFINFDDIVDVVGIYEDYYDFGMYESEYEEAYDYEEDIEDNDADASYDYVTEDAEDEDFEDDFDNEGFINFEEFNEFNKFNESDVEDEEDEDMEEYGSFEDYEDYDGQDLENDDFFYW